MPNGHLIDNEGIEKLRYDHETLRKRLVNLEQKYSGAVGAGVRRDFEIGEVTTEILGDQSTGHFPRFGSGKVTIWGFKAEDGHASGSTAGYYPTWEEDVTVYNMSPLPIQVGSVIQMQRYFRTGFWLATGLSGTAQTAFAKTRVAGIPARVGTAIGEYTLCDLMENHSSGIQPATDVPVWVANMSATAVQPNTYITIQTFGHSGGWICNGEDCG